MKTLIIFYSLGGNTRYVAQKLADLLDADLLELKPEKSYPTGSASKYIAGGFAATIGAQPKLQPYVCDVKQYSLVILASPVWNSRITPPLNTFLSEHSLSGQTVAAFACHGGGGAQKLFDALEAKIGTLALTAAFIDPLSHQASENANIQQFAEKLKARIANAS